MIRAEKTTRVPQPTVPDIKRREGRPRERFLTSIPEIGLVYQEPYPMGGSTPFVIWPKVGQRSSNVACTATLRPLLLNCPEGSRLVHTGNLIFDSDAYLKDSSLSQGRVMRRIASISTTLETTQLCKTHVEFPISFKRCNLMGCMFPTAEALEISRFENCLLNDIKFHPCKSTGSLFIEMTGSTILDSRFEGLLMTEAKIKNTVLANVVFCDCQIQGATFLDCYFKGVTFKGCTLRDVTLRAKSASDFRFEECKGQDVRIQGDLLGLSLLGSNEIKNIQLPGTHLN